MRRILERGELVGALRTQHLLSALIYSKEAYVQSRFDVRSIEEQGTNLHLPFSYRKGWAEEERPILCSIAWYFQSTNGLSDDEENQT